MTVTDLPETSATTFGEHVSAMAPALAHSSEIRTVFNGFPAAVGALCAVVDGVPRGMVATSLAVGVSYDPPMVLFSVRNDSSTWPLLRAAERIGISVLSEDQGAVCRQIASKDGDRFAGLDVEVTDRGALLISGAVSWMECAIEAEVPAGDHTVVTFRIDQVGHVTREHPLLFHDGRFPRMRHDPA